MRSYLLMALALLLAAIAAWLTWPDPQETQPGVSAPPSVEGGVDPESALAEASEGIALPAAPPSGQEPAEGAQTPGRSAVAEEGIRVRLVDAAGHAVADVQLRLGMRTLSSRTPRRVGTEWTDEDGIARFSRQSPTLTHRDAWLQNPQLIAVARLPALSKPHVEFSLEQTNAEVIELRLPPLAEMEVVAFLPSGNPAPFDCWATVNSAAAGTAEDDRAWSQHQAIPIRMRGNRGRIPCAAGLGLRLSVSAADGRCLPGMVYAEGPDEAGSLRSIDVTLGEMVSKVRLRLLNADGSVAAKRKFSRYRKQRRRPPADGSELGPDPSSSERPRWLDTVTTDADGRLEFNLVCSDYTRRWIRQWVFVVAEERNEPRQELDANGTLQVTLNLPDDLAPAQVFDAGDLRVGALVHPLLVAGEVVDADGQPVSAVLQIYRDAGVVYGGQDRRLFSGRPQHDGSFELRAPYPESGMVRVSAGGFGYLGDVAEVAAGTTGVRLVMVRGIDLAGQVLLDVDAPWLELEITMPPGRAKEVFPGGNFLIDYVRPGAHRVSLHHNGRVLWTSPQFGVEGCGRQSPEEIQRIDLRGTTRLWKVRLLDADGKPLPESTSFRALTDDGVRNRVEIGADGVLQQMTLVSADRLRLPYGEDRVLVLEWPLPYSESSSGPEYRLQTP